MKNDYTHKRILLEIAKSVPYAYFEVKNVYDRTKSYDMTIKILNLCCQLQLGYDHILELMEK